MSWLGQGDQLQRQPGDNGTATGGERGHWRVLSLLVRRHRKRSPRRHENRASVAEARRQQNRSRWSRGFWWEVACRAGATTPFHFGDTLDVSRANDDDGSTYGAGRKGAYRPRPLPVGFFGLVNRWGLAELHGQLHEWCGDQWHPDPTGAGWPSAGLPWEGVDPALEALGSAQKELRLLRGGSWFNDPHVCRSAYRNGLHPGNLGGNVGFRVCCLPPGSLLGS
jgi:formylglycine-generating enzyme required for sulfatase activity